MHIDLFAGIPVASFGPARAFYERLFGTPPSFSPHDTEAVWTLAEHRSVYVVEDPERAGHALVTIFVKELDAAIEAVAGRGIDPSGDETYGNGVRNVTFRDADGNQVGFAGRS